MKFKWHIFCLEEESIHEKRQQVHSDIINFPLVIGRRPHLSEIANSKNTHSNNNTTSQHSIHIDNNHSDCYKENNINIRTNSYQSYHNINNGKLVNSNTSTLRQFTLTNSDSPPTYSHSTAPLSTSDSVKTHSINFQAISSNSSSSIQGNTTSLQNKNSKLQNICQSSSSPILSNSNSIDHNSDKIDENIFLFNQRDTSCDDLKKATDYYQQWPHKYQNSRLVANHEGYLYSNK